MTQAFSLSCASYGYAVFMGIGIAAMHYIEWKRCGLPAMCRYSPGLVLLSVVLAIVISAVALRLTYQFARRTASAGLRKRRQRHRDGVAIRSCNYTGMAAVTFVRWRLLRNA